MAGRKKLYATEEERIEAQRESARKYRQSEKFKAWVESRREIRAQYQREKYAEKKRQLEEYEKLKENLFILSQ
jgi:hypothetical protein